MHSDSYTMARYLKRLKSSRLGHVQAFCMYGGLGMFAPSLHRESTDSDVSRLGSQATIDSCQHAVWECLKGGIYHNISLSY